MYLFPCDRCERSRRRAAGVRELVAQKAAAAGPRELLSHCAEALLDSGQKLPLRRDYGDNSFGPSAHRRKADPLQTRPSRSVAREFVSLADAG